MKYKLYSTDWIWISNIALHIVIKPHKRKTINAMRYISEKSLTKLELHIGKSFISSKTYISWMGRKPFQVQMSLNEICKTIKSLQTILMGCRIFINRIQIIFYFVVYDGYYKQTTRNAKNYRCKNKCQTMKYCNVYDCNDHQISEWIFPINFSPTRIKKIKIIY